jgi:hypothetical protein
VTTIADLNTALVDAQEEIRTAQDRLELACRESAEKRSAYREAKAKAFLRFKAQAEGRPTVAELEALVDDACGAQRFAAYLAEAEEYAAKQAHRMHMDLLSSFQTQANLVREELRLTRTGTEYTP